MKNAENKNSNRQPADTGLYVRSAIYDKKALLKQLCVLKEFCDEKGFKYDKSTIFVESGSGMDKNRTKLQLLIRKIKNKELKRVVVCDISRISRNSLFTIEFLQLLKKNNIELSSKELQDIEEKKERLIKAVENNVLVQDDIKTEMERLENRQGEIKQGLANSKKQNRKGGYQI